MVCGCLRCLGELACCACCKACHCSCCCGSLRFARLSYIAWYVIPAVCCAVFMGNDSWFRNGFWAGFPAYKDFDSTRYTESWACNVRFAFTFFVYHLLLALCTLFSLADSTTVIAKVIHRGLPYVKYPFLIGFFFVSFCIPNSFMAGFQYLAVVAGGVFIAIQLVYFCELMYAYYDVALTSNKGMRITGFIIMVIVYLLGLVCAIFSIIDYGVISPPGYDKRPNGHVLGTTIVSAVLCIVNMALGIASPHGSSLANSINSFLIGFYAYFSAANPFVPVYTFSEVLEDGTEVVLHGLPPVPSWLSILYRIVQVIICLGTVIMFNTVELSLVPMLKGTDTDKPYVNSILSDDEDCDAKSSTTTYHIWAFHLCMAVASCVLCNFFCQVLSEPMAYTTFYLNFAACTVGSLMLLWTLVWPWAQPGRIYKH